jgi:SAM-dependent methyltransferase
MVAHAERNHSGIAFRQGDAERLPFEDETFDAVMCAFGVMHLEHVDRAFAEAFRVLRPGGVFAFTQWAKDDELLGIVGSAVATHGRPDVELPPAPPLMRFADPAECQRTLLAHGFEAVSVTTLDLTWIGAEPEDALAMIHGGAVRASMLIEAQPPEQRALVEAAIVGAVRSRPAPTGDGFVVRRPAVLAMGKRAWR